jgi:hypothetical protein
MFSNINYKDVLFGFVSKKRKSEKATKRQSDKAKKRQ